MSFRKVVDGLSKTIVVGEAFHDSQTHADLAAASNNGYPSLENVLGSRKDHWYFGSDDIDTSAGRDVSEALGSTGVPPNLHKQPKVYNCRSPGGAVCQALQLSFSSEHPGVVQVVNCDGSVHQVEEGVDIVVWSEMGTRAGQKQLTTGL